MLWAVLGIAVASLATLFFSTLTYTLRDYSRARLEQHLKRRGLESWLELTVARNTDLIYVTAAGRALANVSLVICAVLLFKSWPQATWARYALAVLVAALLNLVFSVAVPTAVARYAGETMLAGCIRSLHGLRIAMLPIIRFMAAVDRLVRRAVGKPGEDDSELIEKDLLSVVEEGEKEGVVDTQERQMIESVIEFRDTEAGQIMTGRPEIVALELGAELNEVKRTIEESGHSRLPVYDSNLDHIVGILYARDLLKHLGLPPDKFDMRSAMRPAVFVPESKLLRDLLKEFRAQKVHIAIVLDEYGGTAGLVTIEDILEELVGDISDEHEPQGAAMLKRMDNTTFEADARIYLGDLNRRAGLSLPEDAGYDTLGGFVSNALGRIPQKGATFEAAGVRFTVMDAEPQRVKRVRLELLPQPQVTP
jgi:putative hemolysin